MGKSPQQEQGAAVSVEPFASSGKDILSVDAMRQPPNEQYNNSEIEFTITELLKSTKNILHALTAWSNGDMSADQVMDSYHSLEEYFQRACVAFQAVQLALDEVAHVPGDLHSCLEDVLRSPPSVAALEHHLPAIRETILRLLRSLKQKQAQLRDMRPAIPAPRRRATKDAMPELRPRPSSAASSCSSVSLPLASTHELCPSPAQQQSEIDVSDPSSSEALEPVKPQQDNAARRTPVRRAYTAHRVDGYPVAPPRRHPVVREKISMQQQNEREDGMVLFLQVSSRVKRVQVQGQEPVTLPGLRLLFLQNFEQVPDIPIHIRDPNTHIIYELEDADDVVPNSLIILPGNENENNRLQTHQLILDKLELIHQDMLQTQSAVTGAKTTTTTVTQQQQQWPAVPGSLYKALQEKQCEVTRLDKDLEILRQIASKFQTETKEILGELRMKTREYREQTMIDPGGDKNRRYVEETKKRSKETAATITHQIKDLQDTVDHLKLDVIQRRCRPSPLQLEHCDNQVRTLEKEIDAFDQLIKASKPVWKVTWESELQNVVNEQRFVRDQETLLLDLRDDHADLFEVLEQLKKISEIQSRSSSHSKKVVPSPEALFRDHCDGSNGGMASVLKQVSTIEVNHTKRVEALEKAEKLRARELASRIDRFEKELSTFVDEKKLKRTGGPEQADRLRKKKDEEILKELYGACPNKE